MAPLVPAAPLPLLSHQAAAGPVPGGKARSSTSPRDNGTQMTSTRAAASGGKGRGPAEDDSVHITITQRTAGRAHQPPVAVSGPARRVRPEHSPAQAARLGGRLGPSQSCSEVRKPRGSAVHRGPEMRLCGAGGRRVAAEEPQRSRRAMRGPAGPRALPGSRAGRQRPPSTTGSGLVSERSAVGPPLPWRRRSARRSLPRRSASPRAAPQDGGAEPRPQPEAAPRTARGERRGGRTRSAAPRAGAGSTRSDRQGEIPPRVRQAGPRVPL